MKKLGVIITVLFAFLAFGAGIYFKDDAIKFYNNFDKQVKSFSSQSGSTSGWQKTVEQVGKQIFSPSPLNAGGIENKIVLLKSKIIFETNLQRKENSNLPALTENLKLNQAAASKAEDILKNQYFEHVSPSGVGPGELAQKYGYDFIVEGENLILGNFSSEKEVVQDWMNSPGHRANILNVRYSEIGVSIIKGDYQGQTVWVGVQEFGLPASACAEPNGNLKIEIDSERVQLDDLSSQIKTSKIQIEKTDPESAAYNQMINDYNQLISQYNDLAEKSKSDVVTYNNQVNIFNNCVAGK